MVLIVPQRTFSTLIRTPVLPSILSEDCDGVRALNSHLLMAISHSESLYRLPETKLAFFAFSNPLMLIGGKDHQLNGSLQIPLREFLIFSGWILTNMTRITGRMTFQSSLYRTFADLGGPSHSVLAGCGAQ